MTSVKNNSLSKIVDVGMVSVDPHLKEVSDEVLSRDGFNLTFLNLEEIVNGVLQKVYVIDLDEIEDYDVVHQQINHIREQSPDSEIVLLQTEAALSQEQEQTLQFFRERFLVPIYRRPSSKEDPHKDYKSSLHECITTVSGFIHGFLSQPNLIKIGGSIFDLIGRSPDAFLALLEEVKKLHEEGYPLILGTGGGPRLALESDISYTLGTRADYKTILRLQADTIRELLGNVAQYVSPEEIGKQKFPVSYLRDKIPIVSLSGVSRLSSKESDSHILRIAEGLKLYKVIFAKDADGIYERDPYKKPKKVKVKVQFGPITLPFHFYVEADNKYFRQIYASDILNGVINRSDSKGTGEHLIETGALFYLNDTQHVRAVQVINGTKPQLLRPALDGVFTGSYILKG